MLACLFVLENAAGLYSIGSLDHWWYARFAGSLLIAVPLLVWARKQIMTREHKGQIPYVIAFDTTLFLLLGMVLAVTASREWATACLCAGACLLGGGFLGLLFGVPYGRTTADLMATGSVVSPNANGGGSGKAGKADSSGAGSPPAVPGSGPQGAGAEEAPAGSAASAGAPGTAPKISVPNPHAPEVVPPAGSAAGSPAHGAPGGQGTKTPPSPAQAQTPAAYAAATGRNLLEDTASSLSKLLTGASLVKIGSIYEFFQKTSWKIGYYLTDGNVHAGTTGAQQYVSSNIAVLGGGLILYFLLLGFLSGLFLPAYFMKGWEG